MLLSSVWWMIIVLGCVSSQERLSNVETLRRLSLDLRGHPPSVAEIEAVNFHWDVEESAQMMMNTDAFGIQMGDFWAKILNTRQDQTLFEAEELGVTDAFSFSYAVGSEPIYIIQEVIQQHLPWYEILLADWTMVNQDLAALYPVSLLEEQSFAEKPWQKAEYIDGRPNAGILASNGFWWRYETSLNNASRARANQISRIFLCHDYLHQTVTFNPNVDLSNESALALAVQQEPECVSCHASLDPLASFLGGVFVPRKSGFEEMRTYHPEREGIWALQTGVPPAYFGKQGNHLGDLGRFIAEDERFIQCTIEHTWHFLYQRSVQVTDFEHIQQLRNAFVHQQLDYASLILDMVVSDEYRSSQKKILNPEQLAKSIAFLTGFELHAGGYDLIRAQERGFFEILGSNQLITKEISVGMLLFQQQIAQMATEYWFSEAGKELPIVVDALGDRDSRLGKIVQIHKTILGLEPTKIEAEELLDYIEVLESYYDAPMIWQSVIRIVFQDPRFLLY